MKIQSVVIQGFRCFGDRVEISLDDLTTFIGPNASGKTAAMMALVRMFGENQQDRTVRPSDFHLLPGEDIDQVASRELSIEVKLVFLELRGQPATTMAVAECFNQMMVAEPDGELFCRIRLEAKWEDDGTTGGDITQNLYWILTTSVEEGSEGPRQRKVSATERAKIRVIYLAATRDPSAQVRTTTTTQLGRLLDAMNWTDSQELIGQRLEGLRTEVRNLTGVQTLSSGIQKVWEQIYDGRVASRFAFDGMESDPRRLLEAIAPSFSPNESGSESLRYTDLSDGLRALFALSLPMGLFRVEEILRTQAASQGFSDQVGPTLPLLTIFAVEEPENHLSPQYLGKVIQPLLELSRSPLAQVLISSHSASVMKRIQPDSVRYFLGGENRRSTKVSKLELPREQSESFKYVREAVRGYPELYFSRFVVLVEGPSEEIVLTKLFEVSGTPLDSAMISIVPLGGRHVSQFWRLLNGLSIPFITLLDLDREKQGAGWGRIQYIRDELVALYGPDHPRLRFRDTEGVEHSLDESQFDSLLRNNDIAEAEKLTAWVHDLEREFGVFYSVPLDLDFSLLMSFRGAYEAQVPSNGGPRLPASEPERAEAIRERMQMVLGVEGRTVGDLGNSYLPEQRELFPLYKYLFLDRSKPVAHMRAMVDLAPDMLQSRAPDTLLRLVSRVRAALVETRTGR